MEGRIHDYCTNKHDTNNQTVRVGFLCSDDGETETGDNRNGVKGRVVKHKRRQR